MIGLLFVLFIYTLSLLPTRQCTAIPLYAWTTPQVLQEVEAPRISIQSAHEGGKVVSPKHRLPLPRRRYPWYSFLLQVE